VSPLELVDDRFEKLAQELRAAQPVAPVALRERVRALEPKAPRRRLAIDLQLRRLVPAVAIGALAVAVGSAAVIGIVHGSSGHSTALHASKPTVLHQRSLGTEKSSFPAYRAVTSDGLKPAPDRLQQYDASLRVRVHDQEELSKRTQDALRLARRLGGYTVWANYSTPTESGASLLQFQIPIGRVQAAIAAFSGYGTLISQRIRLKDLQRQADDLAARIHRLRVEIASLERTGNDPVRLQRDRARLSQLLHARASTVKRAQMASVALAIVVGKKKAAVPPSRFDRTIDDAGSVLVRELEILVYALVVAGPLLLLGLMGAAAARGARRRSDRRLLERA